MRALNKSSVLNFMKDNGIYIVLLRYLPSLLFRTPHSLVCLT